MQNPQMFPPNCPECEDGWESRVSLDRRHFLRVGTCLTTAAAVGLGLTPLQRARAARLARQAEAEALVFELYRSLDSDQRKYLVQPWDLKRPNQPLPARLMTANAAVGKSVIGLEYKPKQIELLKRIFRAISNGDDGYRQLSRNGKFDNSGDFENIGALLYGGVAEEGQKFSLVFTGHHLTVRCDGNSEEQTAFGGPLYYGHSPSGYSRTNVFYNQTRAVHALYEAFSAKQRKVAVFPGKWRDGVDTVRLPQKDARLPGIAYADMTPEQKELVQKAMQELVAPYRREDGEEVMEIIKANGGLEKIHLAFYQEGQTNPKEPWTYWRLEGPGFVWSFRALPHIHCFVNISARIG
jgi:hypothetical protein